MESSEWMGIKYYDGTNAAKATNDGFLGSGEIRKMHH